MVDPSTPPRHSHPTPALSSPVTPPLPSTPTASHRIRSRNPAHSAPKQGQDDDIAMPTPSSVRHWASGSSPKIGSASSSPIPTPMEVDSSDDFPSDEQLRDIQKALDGVSDGDAAQKRDELKDMLQSLVNVYTSRVPFLREQVVAQQETIATLQQQAKLSQCMIGIERDKFAAERASWQAETQAILRAREAEEAAGTRPKRVLDLDVGYHQELEAANKRLEMDNRLMAPRLVDTQKQIESLVKELRHLRTHVMMNTAVFGEGEGTAPPARSGRTRGTMGDARAEHLLLAAKKVRTMRSSNKDVGHLTLEELRKRGVVGPDGGVGYSEGYGGDDEPIDSDEEKPLASPARGSSSTPLLPRPKKKRAPTTPSRARGNRQAPATTPGGNFNDLLLAAEMATRPGTPTRGQPATVSAARTTHYVPSTFESPSKKPRRAREAPATVEWSSRRMWNSDVSPRASSSRHEEGASALDLLAQASQDVATGGPSRLEGSSRGHTPLGPAIKLDQTPTPGRGFPSADDPFDTFASPTAGAAVPGLGKYVHLSSAMPARRVRSPYLKWTKEEDELLTRAVMEHGEKWDLVSKCVPTRSYHQVRQRWLRKTGAFDKKPAASTTDPSPLGRTQGEQASPTPKGRNKRKEQQ